MLWNAFLLALREIRRNLVRASLTVLGIVIGVASVITMMTLGNGATALITTRVAALGRNLIIVRPGTRMAAGQAAGWAPSFKEEDAQAILDELPSVRNVSSIAQRSATISYMANGFYNSVTGSTPSYLTVGNWKIAEGSFFTDADQSAGRPVCVLGQSARKALFANGSPLGEKIRVRDVACEVIGVFVSKGQSATGQDQDDIVLMPLKAFQRRIAGRRSRQDVSSILVAARDGVNTAKVVRDVSNLLRERRGLTPNEADNFSVSDAKQIAQTLSSSTRTLTTLLGIVAAVGLLVGGIGIMNVMLVSVTERTREIGTRLAIGALEHEVLLQFLVEAVALSAFGGLCGIVLALIVSAGLTHAMELPLIFDLKIILTAFFVSAGIGVIFGFVPARRAARLDPIEALRHE